MRLQAPLASAWQEFRMFCKVLRISPRRFFSSPEGFLFFARSASSLRSLSASLASSCSFLARRLSSSSTVFLTSSKGSPIAFPFFWPHLRDANWLGLAVNKKADKKLFFASGYSQKSLRWRNLP